MGQAAHVDIVLVRQANHDDQLFHIDVQRVDILVEKTRISFERISLRFYNRRLMFRSAIYCTSGEERSVTKRDAIFRMSCSLKSLRGTLRMRMMITCRHINHGPTNKKNHVNIPSRRRGQRSVVPVNLLELWCDTFTYMLAFLLVLRLIPCQCRQHGNAAPLGTFVERDSSGLSG